MANTIDICQKGFETSRLFESTDALRRFIVEDVCDVYVEFSKSALNRSDLDQREKVISAEFGGSSKTTNCNRMQRCGFYMHVWTFLCV